MNRVIVAVMESGLSTIDERELFCTERGTRVR